jgi:hypothetical protein
LVVTGAAVPYFASFAYTLEMNQLVIAVLEGRVFVGSVEFARGANIVLAVIFAFGFSLLFRALANVAIRDVED